MGSSLSCLRRLVFVVCVLVYCLTPNTLRGVDTACVAQQSSTSSLRSRQSSHGNDRQRKVEVYRTTTRAHLDHNRTLHSDAGRFGNFEPDGCYHRACFINIHRVRDQGLPLLCSAVPRCTEAVIMSSRPQPTDRPTDRPMSLPTRTRWRCCCGDSILSS